MQREKSRATMEHPCQSSSFFSTKRIPKAKKTKNLSIAGSKIAPNCVAVLRLRARYPSMLSVSIARKIARSLHGILSIRNKKASGALKKDKLLDKLNIEPSIYKTLK